MSDLLYLEIFSMLNLLAAPRLGSDQCMYFDVGRENSV